MIHLILCHPQRSDPGRRTLSIGIFPILGDWCSFGEDVDVVVEERKPGPIFVLMVWRRVRARHKDPDLDLAIVGALSPGHS